MNEIWTNHKTKLIIGCVGSIVIFGLICGGFTIFSGWVALNVVAGALDEVTESASNPPSGSAFYEDVGGADFDRIPLIEPYQVIGINDFWQIDLYEDVIKLNHTGEVSNVTVVNQSVIIAEALRGYGDSGSIEGPIWYVVIPNQNVELQFTSQTELDDYLQTQGVYSYTLNDVRSVYQTFVQNRRLDWFPTSTE